MFVGLLGISVHACPLLPNSTSESTYDWASGFASIPADANANRDASKLAGNDFMKRFISTARVRIWGNGGSWSVVPADFSEGSFRQVSLIIEGTEATGFLLLKEPEGCFQADGWELTLDEAFKRAEDVFGTPRSAWTDVSDAP
ncbi:MAG: hypothetical protein AAGA54_18120 [Myxococcota bacterium]